MKIRNTYTSWVRTEVLVIWLSLLLSSGAAYAENAHEDFVPSLQPAQEGQSPLIPRLRNVRRDVEAFYKVAETSRNNADKITLAQLQYPVDDFLKMHVDNLLAQSAEQSTLETTRLTAEIKYIKARLFMSLNRRDAASATVADMKKQLGLYLKISVELPDKTTTLDEGLRLLDEELAKTATTKK